MSIQISVIIPTFSPHKGRFEQTLAGLRSQSLPLTQWELVVIDNATPDKAYVPGFDLSWHINARIVREDRPGLTWARLAGIKAANSDYLIFVDDDNILFPDYLENTLTIFKAHPKMGVAGGKSLPQFEQQPEPWVSEFYGCLALRDLGDEERILPSPNRLPLEKYPDYAPIGAGMVLHRDAAQIYAQKILNNPNNLVLDRTGNNLTSGGDNDIVLTVWSKGWELGYFPQLKLFHIIPPVRTTKEYLAKLNRSSMRSWVQVLDLHGIRPWPRIPNWTVLPRKLRAFFRYRPWQDSASYIRWQSSCGHFEGLSMLSPLDKKS